MYAHLLAQAIERRHNINYTKESKMLDLSSNKHNVENIVGGVNIVTDVTH